MSKKYLGDCNPNTVLSRVCENGTRGCDVYHVDIATKSLDEMLNEAEDTEDEICICAAWWAKNDKVYRGHRHIHCLDAMGDEGTEPLSKGDMGQGFMTSHNRFVSRSEGYLLQVAANIKSVAKDGYRNHRLFSEDLY